MSFTGHKNPINQFLQYLIIKFSSSTSFFKLLEVDDNALGFFNLKWEGFLE